MATCIDASLVACPRINSTSVISGTGFMKCMPSTLSGRLVAAPMSVMEIDDVLVARITSGRVMRVELPKQRALGLHRLDDGFDDVVGRGEVVEPERDREPASVGIAIGRRSACPFRRTCPATSRCRRARGRARLCSTSCSSTV